MDPKYKAILDTVWDFRLGVLDNGKDLTTVADVLGIDVKTLYDALEAGVKEGLVRKEWGGGV